MNGKLIKREKPIYPALKIHELYVSWQKGCKSAESTMDRMKVLFGGVQAVVEISATSNWSRVLLPTQWYRKRINHMEASSTGGDAGIDEQCSIEEFRLSIGTTTGIQICILT
jgi:hypothetical protein